MMDSAHDNLMKFRIQLSQQEPYTISVKVGYWPCLKAPFIQFTFWRCRMDIWYGLPSYKR